MSDYWTKNNIEKPQAIVVCAANKYGNLIIPSARHHDHVMNAVIAAIGGLKNSGSVQGFINQFGEFLTRKEAMLAAKESGQYINPKGCGGDMDVLYSECLY